MASEKKVTRGFFLKSPGKTARSFAVIGFEEAEGKRQNFTVKDERVVALNLAFKDGTLSLERAREEGREIVRDLYRKLGSPSQSLRRAGLLSDNQKVFERFWEEVYEGKELQDASSARYDYLRALKALGATSILTATKTELAKVIRKNAKNVSQQRRIVDRLNTLLKHLGRELRLEKPEEELKEIKHLTLEDLQSLLKLEEDPGYRDFYATLFATGLRLGESMAVLPQVVFEGKLHVGSQITSAGKKKLPKRRKTGEVVIISGFDDAVHRWAGMSGKQSYRHNINRRLKRLCRTLWPKDPSKHISVHGFRHSHAIHLLTLGVPMEMVAKNLRNRIEVCQKHYAGYAHTPSTLQALMELLKKASQS